ncbi:hypothetical protein SAMN02949497_0449 [Methylomagnum ishizawai]|uniref:Uncharacterized protein n=1 Tax=Methylomagnum ishizawai TaxID=1760988 RepID=A0A1Y6D4S1_9GAMM|nr:hypothetical protein [Methylomagnum ishizawai]SMF97420.1 hypothetical protein SAMN02949497_0449 [Methylomagnum ishizawai]
MPQNTTQNPHDFATAFPWLWNRLREKSTWSGLSLVVICLLVLFGLPIVKMLAWLGLAYGVYTISTAG